MDFLSKEFLQKYSLSKEDISKNQIDPTVLNNIFKDFNSLTETYETQAEFIASTLRSHGKIHSVKSRVKNPDRLLEKIIRKTPDRKNRYGDDFQFSTENYKDEITDLIGIRVIHIFKEDWEDIHSFIIKTWNVIEITANVRDGDDTERFKELDIQIQSRKSGYRSVHYLIEFYPTNQKVIAEIQVRTIFEEGYGEIDHQLRYSHNKIPEVLALNLLLFNRIVGSADEMASLINMLSRNLTELEEKYDNIVSSNDSKIEALKEIIKGKSSMDSNDKTEILEALDNIILNDDLNKLKKKVLNNFGTVK